MREFAKISPIFWIGERGRTIKQLGIEAHHLAIYLLTNPHASMMGIYYLPVAVIAHETALSCENAVKSLQDLSAIDYCSYDPVSEYVWVHDMAFDQIGRQLKPNDNRVKGANNAYHLLPELPFLPAFFDKYADTFYLTNDNSSGASCKSLTSKEKEKDNDKDKEKEKNISLSGKPDVVPLFLNHSNPNLTKTASLFHSQSLEVLNFLNEKTGRIYRPVDANLKLIIARLKTGATVMDCRQVIAKKVREWKGDPKMAEYLRPATLFNATKFEQYMGELVLPHEKDCHEYH